MRGRKTWYYYDHGGTPRREEALGSDYGLAIKRWAEIEREGAEKPRAAITFRHVCDRYRAEVVPTKAAATQRDNGRELTKLIEFFDDPPGPLDAVEPQHVKQYLRWRKDAPVRANREKALLSHVWNWAREQGYTKLPNPCAGVKGFKETGRDVYVEDDAFKAVWTAADIPLRDAMDLAYLTGQRPADTLSMSVTDVRDGALHVRQRKTGKALRIEVVGELAAVLERIAARKKELKVHALRLIIDESGRPLGRDALRYRFDKAREAAKIEPSEFQFRDLRAKAGTDKADAAGDVREAQRQLGHSSVVMTEHYIRERRGDKVKPTR
jgi:integrase